MRNHQPPAQGGVQPVTVHVFVVIRHSEVVRAVNAVDLVNAVQSFSVVRKDVMLRATDVHGLYCLDAAVKRDATW